MTSATVNGRWTTHPRLVAGAVGSACVAIGLTVGSLVGAELGARSVQVRPSGTQNVASPASYGDTRARPGSVRVEQVLPSSAPGNPYVNIHVPFREPVDLTPSSSPGDAYLDNLVPPRA